MNVLVTGATGFVGRAFVPRLLSDGHAVRAVFHHAPAGIGKDVTWVRWHDVADEKTLSALVGGAEVVVHLAGLAHLPSAEAGRAAAEFMRVNRDATAALARAAAKAGARRFIYLSSVKACGEVSPRGPWTEDEPRNPVDPYGQSKSQAEDRIAEIANASGMEATVLRPPLIYGPGVQANFLAMVRWLDRGLPWPVAATENRRSLLFIGNLVDALARCIAHPAVAGRTYFISDGEDVSTAELASRIGRALDRPTRTVKVPLPMVRLAARILGRPGAAERLAGSLAIDSSRIRNDLGWSPPYLMAQGLEQTVEWYRRRG